MDRIENQMAEELNRILQEKEARRRRQAALPYPEKVRIIIEMQRRVAPIYRARGIHLNVWEIDEPDPNSGKT